MATKVSSADLEKQLESMLDVEKFPPPEDFQKQALVTDESMYEEAAADLEGFWAKQAEELIDWSKQPYLHDSPGVPLQKCPVWYTGVRVRADWQTFRKALFRSSYAISARFQRRVSGPGHSGPVELNWRNQSCQSSTSAG